METMTKKGDPVGIHEIADRLGVKVVTVRLWRWQATKGEGPPLPEPEYTVSGSPAWEWDTFLRWAGEHGHIHQAPNADELQARYRQLTGAEPRAQYVGAGQGVTNEAFRAEWVGKKVRHKETGVTGKVVDVRAHQPRLVVRTADRRLRWSYLDVDEA